VNVRMASYDRLDGRDLRNGAFLTTANQFRDEAEPFDVETLTLEIARPRTTSPAEAEPFDVETLTLEIDSRVLTFTGTYGVTDRFDISAAVPLVQLSMNGTRVNTYRGNRVVQAVAEATSRGLGDVVVRGKYGLLNGPSNGLA